MGQDAAPAQSEEAAPAQSQDAAPAKSEEAPPAKSHALMARTSPWSLALTDHRTRLARGGDAHGAISEAIVLPHSPCPSA